MTYPRHMAVRITDPEDDLHGEIAFIYTRPGEETSEGIEVEDGWYELALDPWDHGYGTELYREEDFDVCGC